MNTLKKLACDWLPPAIVRLIRQRRGGDIRFEGDFATWEEARAQCTGYDTEEILANVLDSTLKVKRGEAAFERDSVLFEEIEYAWPVLSGLMWAAARNGGMLNVLDFGGALGSSYFQNRNLLQTLPEVCWGVVEQAHYVEAGRIHLQDQHLRFYRSIGECLAENKPNVILLSSVLQYLTDPYGVLQELLSIGSDTLIFDRTSYLNDNKIEIIKIQHVPKSIYQACYPCRFFVEENLCSYVLGRGYKLIETFGSLDRLDSLATWKGHIFAREMHA